MDTQFVTDLLRQDAFTLFNLPHKYLIDQAKLNDTYHDLQKKYHPDNFVGNENQALIAQVSAQINHSFTILRSPLTRALILLEIHQHKLDLNANSSLSPQLLLAQMELHDEIADAGKDMQKLQEIEAQIHQKQLVIENQIAHEFDVNNFEGVKKLVIELSFYNRLNTQIALNINNLW